MNGRKAGTNDGVDDARPASSAAERRVRRQVWLFVTVLLALAALAAIGSASFIPRVQRGYDLWEITLWEVSSGLAAVALAPLCFHFFSRFGWKRIGVWRFIGLQMVLVVAFSLAHVAGMVLLRKAAYASLGQGYDFTGGRPLNVFAYEFCKDAFTYLVFLVCFWRAARRLVPATVARTEPFVASPVELRVDGRRRFVMPEEITFIEAAGNYVEVHVGAETLLVRGTLARFEETLKALNFVRVHRRFLINKRHVHDVAGTTSGNFQIAMKDGRVLAASRRYKSGLT